MNNRSFTFLRSVILIFIVFVFGCAKQNQKILEPKSNVDFTTQELCYINNKALSYIMESNDMVYDSEFFTMLKFDKKKSHIMYRKMKDSILEENMKYVIDSMDKSSIKIIKNKIEVLNICNSTQLTAHFVDESNQTIEHQLSATSKYKCDFTISDIVQTGDLYFVFLEYSEYFDKIKEIEKLTLGFQFRKCKNNGFIKFENFLEWQGEMFGHMHFKLFTIRNDSIILNDIPKDTRFQSEAIFLRKKIKNFECDIK